MSTSGISLSFGANVAWIACCAFYYGYNISALNALQGSITCPSNGQAQAGLLPECVPMTTYAFGSLTAVFNIGGLAGSLIASSVADRNGRKAALRLVSALLLGGSALMGIGRSLAVLVLGRFLIGIGCGLATVVVPIFLAEVSPPHLRDRIGSLNQLGIVVGIFCSIALGLPFARPTIWRAVFFISAVLAILHLVVSSTTVESPAWAASQNSKLPAVRQEEEGLLPTDASEAAPTTPKQPLSLKEAFQSDEPAVKHGLRVVMVAMMLQQASGINAAFYFSTTIFQTILPPESARYISLMLAGINVLFTLAPTILLARFGKRKLLSLSCFGIIASSAVLGFAINTQATSLASFAIIFFVISFSIGLGPIPFILISEAVPPHATSAAGSLGLSLNWSVAFLVAFLFLPLRDAFASTVGGEGSVFFVFALVASILTIYLLRIL